MSQPKLYLFVGYPGSGKTTIARLIAAATGAVHIWADHERQQMFGKPNLTETEITTFYEQLNQKTADLLASGHSVVFDTNFNFRSDRERLRGIAQENGAETVTIWVNTPVEIARIRAVEQSHGVDTRVWGNMTPDDFERLSNKLEAPSADEHAIEINGADIDISAVKSRLGL